MTYAAKDILTRDDIRLTQGGLILIGVLRGGDYSEEDVGSSYQYAPPNAQFNQYGGKPASLVGGISGSQMYNQKGRGGYPPAGGY